MIGCRAYLNQRLLKAGMSIVFECSVQGKASDVNEVLGVAAGAQQLMRDLLKVDLHPVFSERELIGRTFSLYKFRLHTGLAEVGEARVVLREANLINVSGALYVGALALLPNDVRDELSSGRALEVGENVGFREALRDCPASGDVPVGQTSIPKFVVYSAEGHIPSIPASSWSLTIEGPVVSKVMTYNDVKALSQDRGQLDFHCVTGWSVRGRRYSGVLLSDLIKSVEGASDVRWIYAESVTGYSSVLPASEASRTLLVLEIDGRPLAPENGGPARLFNPNLYGWKGVKWVTRISLERDYIDGFWEALAYHERGLVSRNERFKIRNPEVVDLC
ncbi:MAG: molybdopterin-dependent oxidoreductase [Acidilobus sp.]